MLLNGDDGALHNHECIWILIKHIDFVNIHAWGYVFSYHVGAQGSTQSMEGLTVFLAI